MDLLVLFQLFIERYNVALNKILKLAQKKNLIRVNFDFSSKEASKILTKIILMRFLEENCSWTEIDAFKQNIKEIQEDLKDPEVKRQYSDIYKLFQIIRKKEVDNDILLNKFDFTFFMVVLSALAYLEKDYKKGVH